jgi:hypothetical protein
MSRDWASGNTFLQGSEGTITLMVWAVVIAGGAGLLLGLWLRVPAVLPASAVAVATGMVLTTLTNWPLLHSVMYCAALLATLQVGYLVGGALACIRSR